MIRSVSADGKEIKYDLILKSVKNINLRIRADGSVVVSASPERDADVIDQFVTSNAAYIEKCLTQFAQIAAQDAVKRQYVSGESFSLLGRSLRLMVHEESKEQVLSDGVYLHLYVKDKTNQTRKEHLISRFYQKQCQEVFGGIIDEMYPIFRKYGVSRPVLRIRNMRTRWGTCLPGKGVITLTKKLIETPKSCIEYVILHEYCHFLVLNHTKVFYQKVAMFMPDWKQRKDELERIGIYGC